MRWLLVLWVLVFGVAAVGSATVSSASSLATPAMVETVGSTGAIICEDLRPARDAVAFKPCGKLRNGLAIPCDPLPAVLPQAQSYEPEVVQPAQSWAGRIPETVRWIDGPYRPPRPATSA